MKKSILFFILTLGIFFTITQTFAMSAPRTAKLFYFAQIDKISNTENHATIYSKQSCFAGDTHCINDIEPITIDKGSGYSIDKFSSLPSQSAIPILSFNYNPQNWELQENTGQVHVLPMQDANDAELLLVNKSDKNKIIDLLGENNRDYRFFLSVKNKMKDGNPRELDASFTKKIGNFIYVFTDTAYENKKSKKIYPHEFLYSIIPHVFILQGDKLSDQDKQDYFKLLESVQYSRQYLGNIAREEYVYNHASRLFFDETTLSEWTRYMLYPRGEFERLQKEGNCGLNWPDYLNIRNTSVSLNNPNIDIGEIEAGKTPETALQKFKGTDCENREGTLYADYYKKTVLEATDPFLNQKNKEIEAQINSCSKTQINFSSLTQDQIQVYSAYGRVTIGTEREGNNTFFDFSHLDKNKFNAKSYTGILESHEVIFYPYMRLYAYKIQDAQKYLVEDNDCLKFTFKDHWVYLGYDSNYAIFAEFIPDAYPPLNTLFQTNFWYKIFTLNFYDTGYKPLDKYRLHISTDGIHTLKALELGKTDWFESITKYRSSDVYQMPLFEVNDYNNFVEKNSLPNNLRDLIPENLRTYIMKQFDTPPSKTAFAFVGQNEDCEKTDEICVDFGSGWDYMSKGSTMAKTSTLLETIYGHKKVTLIISAFILLIIGVIFRFVLRHKI